jgi:hypothetical protein
MSISANIVTVIVSQQQAPTPSTLQQTGAFISQGGTNTAPGTLSLLTQLADLTPLLANGINIATITWSGGTATATLSTPHGLATSDTMYGTVTGATPSGYNVTNVLFTSTGPTTLTYPIAINPGAPASIAGTFTNADVAELTYMATTYFNQGAIQTVYVLEIGEGSPADGITYLQNWITLNPQFVYVWLIPKEWTTAPTYPSFVANYQAPNKMVYFVTTTSASNYSAFSTLDKELVSVTPAPNVSSVEFTAAAWMYNMTKPRPSSTNQVLPLNYDFIFSTTPWPILNNASTLQTLLNNNVNYPYTGAEGGITTGIIKGGTTMDGRDFQYWYATDWAQITLKLNLSNAIINGSNNPVNPLYFDQNGINRLAQVVASTMSSGSTFGLVLFPPKLLGLDGPILDQVLDANTYVGFTIINAVPFINYVQENPGDYKAGIYKGLSVIFVPKRGFDNIQINLVVSDFPGNTA